MKKIGQVIDKYSAWLCYFLCRDPVGILLVVKI